MRVDGPSYQRELARCAIDTETRRAHQTEESGKAGRVSGAGCYAASRTRVRNQAAWASAPSAAATRPGCRTKSCHRRGQLV